MRDTQSQIKILIVDDLPMNRDILKEMLSEYEIVEAEDGIEAVAYLREHHESVALVLLDLIMPKMDGFAVLETMKQEGWLDSIPVIVESSETSDEMMERAFAYGVSDFFDRSTISLLVQKRVYNTIRSFVKQKAIMKQQKEVALLTDSLTGFLNMEGFCKKAPQIMLKNPDTMYAIWFADLKNFKLVNNSFGYEKGNEILKYWCSLVSEQIKDDNLVCRVIGDQLLGLHALKRGNVEYETDNRIHSVWDEVVEHFPKELKDLPVFICSGVYMAGANDIEHRSLDQMMGYAREALKNAKDMQGGGQIVYNEELWIARQRSFEISSHLEQGLQNHEVTMFLQPQYNHATGEITGAEALCRWTHKTLGFLSPAEFIPVLENTGQIFQLDSFIWEEACIYMRKWLDQGICMPVSVNISRKDVLVTDLSVYFIELVKKYDLPPSMLRLEITENAYIDESDKLIETVKKLKEQGFTVEMDDFGSGFSSLNMLQNVPVDVLKLDMGFLRKTQYNIRSGNIISAVVKMSHALDIDILAEGVETIEQANFLKNIGCTDMQGYYFSKPIPVEEFEKNFLMEHKIETNRQKGSLELYKMRELLDANSSSSFLFNYCMGAASLLEYNGEKVQFVLVNDSFYQELDKDRTLLDAHRQNVLMAFREETRESIKQALDAAIEKGVVVTELSDSVSQTYWRVTIRFVSTNNYVSLLFCEIQDITKDRKLKNEVSVMQEEFKAHMELMPCGVLRYEADGNQEFAYVSKSMLDMLGYQTLDEFYDKFGRGFKGMIYEEDRERTQGEIANQIKLTGVEYCEYRIEKADGDLMWVFDRGHLVEDQNGKKWFYVVIADIDELKRETMDNQCKAKIIDTLLQIDGSLLYEYDPALDYMKMRVKREDGEIVTRTALNYLAELEQTGYIEKEDVPVFADAIHEVTKTGNDKEVIVKALFPNRKYLSCKYYFSAALDDNGKVYRIVGRAQKMAEE